MSDPIANPTELGVYLGVDIDPGDRRADLLLQLAHDRCEMIVNPVPVLAKGIELEVAGRAWVNVSSARQMSLGSASVSYGASALGGENSTSAIGGLYLSKSNKADLRRLAGRTGAFSVDLLPATVPPTVVPVVSNIDPDGAETGDLVRVEGYGFTDATSVTFNATASEFVEVSDTVLHVAVPAGGAGDVSVIVTNAVGASVAYIYERG